MPGAGGFSLKPGQLDSLSFELDASSVLFYLVDCNNRVLFLNQPLIDIVSFGSLGEITGQHIRSPIMLYDGPTVTTICENNHLVMELNQPCELIEECTLNDNHTFYLSHKEPIYDHHGAIVGTYGYSVDVGHLDNPLDALEQKERLLTRPHLDPQLLYLKKT